MGESADRPRAEDQRLLGRGLERGHRVEDDREGLGQHRVLAGKMVGDSVQRATRGHHVVGEAAGPRLAEKMEARAGVGVVGAGLTAQAWQARIDHDASAGLQVNLAAGRLDASEDLVTECGRPGLHPGARSHNVQVGPTKARPLDANAGLVASRLR